MMIAGIVVAWLLSGAIGCYLMNKLSEPPTRLEFIIGSAFGPMMIIAVFIVWLSNSEWLDKPMWGGEDQ